KAGRCGGPDAVPDGALFPVGRAGRTGWSRARWLADPSRRPEREARVPRRQVRRGGGACGGPVPDGKSGGLCGRENRCPGLYQYSRAGRHLSGPRRRGAGRRLGAGVQRPQFYQALENTTYYTVGTLILLIPIPIILAALLHSKLTKGAGVYQTATFLPALTSLVVVGAVFRLLLDERGGIVNAALMAVGLAPQKWLTSAALVIPSLLILAFWRWTGVNIIYFLSGLTAIPQELYEAAAIEIGRASCRERSRRVDWQGLVG